MSLKMLAQAGDLDLDFGLGDEDDFLMSGVQDQKSRNKKETSVLRPIPFQNNQLTRRSSRLSKKFSDIGHITNTFDYGGDKMVASDSILDGINPIANFQRKKSIITRGAWQ